MKPYSEQRYGDRWQESYVNGTYTKVFSRVASQARSLQVYEDTLTKPADRTKVHPQWYGKATTQSTWYGLIIDREPGGVNYSKTTGCTGQAYSHPYRIPTGLNGIEPVYNQALSRIYESIRGQVDMAVNLAEAGQTVNLRKSFYRAIVAIRYFRRTFGRITFSKLADVSSEAWLTWQYGVRPLLQDFYTAADQLTSGKFLGLRIVEGSAKAFYQDSGTRTPAFGNVLGPLADAERFVDWSSQRCRIELRFKLDDTVLRSLGDFSSLNPASLAWETLPYSFVVDWFVNVSGYLRNMESAFLYRNMFVTGYLTYTWKYGTSSVVVKAYKDPNNGHEMTYNLYANSMGSGKRRQVLSSIPMPHLPQFSVKLGWQRIASAASLIYKGVGIEPWSDVRYKRKALSLVKDRTRWSKAR